MGYIEILKLVITLLPILVDAIKAVEQLFPETGNGKLKLDLVKAMLENTIHLNAEFSQVWPVMEKMVSSIVNAFNSNGIFSTKRG